MIAFFQKNQVWAWIGLVILVCFASSRENLVKRENAITKAVALSGVQCFDSREGNVEKCNLSPLPETIKVGDTIKTSDGNLVINFIFADNEGMNITSSQDKWSCFATDNLRALPENGGSGKWIEISPCVPLECEKDDLLVFTPQPSKVSACLNLMTGRSLLYLKNKVLSGVLYKF